MTELVAGLRGAVGGLPSLLRQPDRVWLAILLLFAGLAAYDLATGDTGQALASLRFTADAFLWIAPFLLLSVGLAAWLKAAGADQLISRAVARRPLPAILIAAGFGALSPFCSCGVVPLVAALLAAGMPLPAVMAFWIASPLMDPESFVLMAATIGLGFTVAKTVAAVAMGLIGGLATWGLMGLGLGKDPLKAVVGCGSSCGGGVSEAGVHWRFWNDPPRLRAFAEEARAVALFLAKWLLLAFAIESLMVAWLPPDLIATTLGGDTWQAVPLAVLVGVPAYLNGFAAIPLIGGLLDMGMAPGAAMAFLTAGAVTSLPAAMAVFALVKLRVFAWYLVLALFGSLATGIGYQILVTA